MNTKKIISLIMISILILGVAVAATGCGKKEPKTLEKYLEEDESAKKEIDDMAKTMSGDQFDIDIDVSENDMSVVLKLKETYDESILESLKPSIDEEFNKQAESIGNKIKDLEEKGDLTNVTMTLKIQNGDGTDISSSEFTSADASEDAEEEEAA